MTRWRRNRKTALRSPAARFPPVWSTRRSILRCSRRDRFWRSAAANGAQKPKTARNRIQSYADLHPGDLIVHDLHGIGRFVGIEKIKTDHVERDYIKLQYSGTDVLFIPATQLDMVSKYIGSAGEDTPVRLNKLSGTEWHKTKTRKDRRARYGEALDRPLRGADASAGVCVPAGRRLAAPV